MAISATLSFMLTVRPITAGVYSNVATVSVAGDVISSNNTTTDTVSVGAANTLRDIAITKTHSGNFTAGVDNFFTITVRNVGTTTISAGDQIIVTDTLPSRMTYLSMAGVGSVWSCSYVAPDATCSHTLASNFNVGDVLTLTMSVRPTAVGTYNNYAVVKTLSLSSLRRIPI
jgi:uncharacterized repeat protein (TIGR01451 family)